MPHIGERLRATREAMGVSQQELADRCGVTMRSQRNYEKGERSPDAEYLAALAAAGADVLYILTGVRTGEASAPAQARAVSDGDRVLLDNFHAAPAQVQAGVKTALGAFAPAGVGKRRQKAA